MKMKMLTVLCLSTWPVLLVAPGTARGAPSEAEGATLRLVVDAKELGETSEVYEDVVATKLRSIFQQAGYAVDDSIRADATVRVRIVFYNEADLDYQIEIDVSAGAQFMRMDSIGCPQCADEDLVAKIDAASPDIVAALEQVLAQVGPGPTEIETRPPDQETASTPEPAPRSPLTALGGVGIGVAALGVGSLIAGGVELARGRIYDERPQLATERTFVDHRPPGAVLLGVGGALVLAGATMLVVDLLNAKKRRSEAVSAHPLVSPTLVGLGLTGNF